MKQRKVPMAKVALVHPGLGFGGSEAPVLWTIEALKGDCSVTLISMGEVDLPRLNAYYGTTLAPEDFSLKRAPLPMGLRNTTRFAGLKGSFVHRYVRQIAPEFDVLISCYGPMDFGKPGLQMIADFSFVQEWRFSLHPGVRSWNRWWYDTHSPVRQVYLAICRWISGSNPEGWRQNLTLSNSHWTAVLMREKYGMESQTLYPPVQSDFAPTPFADRENGFVCLGRISPEKRVDAIIEILSQVRERGHNIHLHILGGCDDSPYGALVKKLADRNKEWVRLEGWAIGPRKNELLAGHRYGIHGRENEPFGIAVAEMVLAGCIVFVPKGGGQVEIVNHPNLVFESDSDAVEKIARVLTNDSEQERLRTHLREASQIFSVENFKEAMRNVVAEFLDQRVAY